MIYLDNAATSFPKPKCIIRDLSCCLKKYCGNPGRSSHRLSLLASEAIYSVREEIAELLSVKSPENVVFTLNATYALNLAIKTFIKEKCHVLTSDFEHNSVIRPLEALKRKIGVEYSAFCTEGDIEKSIKDSLRSDTKGIVASIASNVTGDSISLKIISKALGSIAQRLTNENAPITPRPNGSLSLAINKAGKIAANKSNTATMKTITAVLLRHIVITSSLKILE